MYQNTVQGVEWEMTNVDFWIEKLQDKDCLIMNYEEIDSYNKKIIQKVSEMCDIEAFSNTITKEELINYLNIYKVPQRVMYDINGQKIDEVFYRNLCSNLDLNSVYEENEVKFGVVVRNTSLRSFPDSNPVFKTPEDKEFDRFQETGLQAYEPCAVIHASRDGRWYLVQAYNYLGWVNSDDIALGTNKKQVFDYINSKDFITVTGNYARSQYNPFDESVSNLIFSMGTKIPLEIDSEVEHVGNQSCVFNYIVKLAVRNRYGMLEVRNGLIGMNEDVTEGYLLYTRANILRQAFKLQGERYGWGDSFNGRDCSSTVMYVYKAFGIRLPRNADQQEIAEGLSLEFPEGASIESRNAVLNRVKPGAAIFMPGHEMMYIGKHAGIHYMIHNFNGYGKKVNGEYSFTSVNEVAVTSTLLKTLSGIPFISKFTSVIQYE